EDERLGGKGELGQLEVKALGMHNVRNALAACCVGLCLGLRFPHIADGLRMYDGVRRRLQVCGEQRGVLVVEDYAHHPTELESTIEAARWIRPRRIIAVFQPHLFSRTKFFCEQFAEVLSKVDQAVVTDIYPSREQPMAGVDSGLIVDAARQHGAGNVQLINDMHAVPGRIADDLKPGDMVLVLGAGNINQIAEPLLQEMARQS
ncbi:MAG: cyanophycin synthetase, partial [Candidatus Hydrogenedentota bacterium]